MPKNLSLAILSAVFAKYIRPSVEVLGAFSNLSMTVDAPFAKANAPSINIAAVIFIFRGLGFWKINDAATTIKLAKGNMAIAPRESVNITISPEQA